MPSHFATPQKAFSFYATADICGTNPVNNASLTPNNFVNRLRMSNQKKQNPPKLASSLGTRSPQQFRLDSIQSDFSLLTIGSNSPVKKPQINTSNGNGSSLSKTNSSKPATRPDRFIAKCELGSSQSHIDLGRPSSSASSSGSEEEETQSREFTQNIAEACGLALNTRILSYKPAAPENKKYMQARYSRPLRSAGQIAATQRRKISTTPERVLDAPGLVDDYYLNLLDWSTSNKLAVGLDQSVYIWNANHGSVSCLFENHDQNYISSLKCSHDGAYLSVGLSDGDVQIWDLETCTKIRSMLGHSARVGVLSWNDHILSSGCRDGSIANHDVRVRDHKVSDFNYHCSEVCGLAWRLDGAQLASGGNDNNVCIWDSRSHVPKFVKNNHTAAVKALAWSPWQNNILCTGGGTSDRKIHWWNTTNGARTHTVDTGSQVTSLQWSSNYKEVLSTHGWPENQISVWSFGSKISKQIDIPAHDSRVLHSALSPDGQTLATAAADENLKFFKVWAREKSSVRNNGISENGSVKESIDKCMTIR